MANRQRIKGRKDAPKGFAGIPRHVMDHPDYQRLSGGAVKLLVEFCRQYKGLNNGDLTAAHSLLKNRGFVSKGTIARAVDELLKAEMIFCSRTGQFTNPGGRCALFALSWRPIDECKGKNLDIEPTTIPPRQFSLENKTPCPEPGPSSVHKQGRPRPRNEKGKFVSVHKQARLMVVT